LNGEEEHALENAVCGLTANCLVNKVDKVTTRRQAAVRRKYQPSCQAMLIADFLMKVNTIFTPRLRHTRPRRSKA